MNERTMSRPGAAAAIVAGTLLLAGCGASAPQASEDDEATRFLACLTAAGVEARISEQTGMVLVRRAPVPSENGVVTFSDSGDGAAALMTEGDSAGNLWIAAESADFFVDDPAVQDAYGGCEAEHPGFVQPEFDPGAMPGQQEYLEQQAADGLAFARCARDAGFAWVGDPIGEPGSSRAIALPLDLTEPEFRALLEACWSPDLGMAWAVDGELGFDWVGVLEEFSDGAVTEGPSE